MKQSESNYLTMVQAVLANLRKDHAFWSEEPEIVSEVEAIESEYNLATEGLGLVSGLDSTGYTHSKNFTLDTTVRSTFKLCRKMCVYARRNNDNVILQLADHSVSSLSAGMEKDVISRCNAIINKAESMLDVLSPFKITADELANIRQLIGVYNEHIEGRSTVKTSKTVSIQDISDLVESLNNRIAILDDMIEGFIEDEDVIARYKAARIIVNYGKGKTAKKQAESTETETAAN